MKPARPASLLEMPDLSGTQWVKDQDRQINSR